MRAACEAIGHPIYGVADDDDPWRVKLDARIHKTPEGMLRDAFEHALRTFHTRFWIIDEAHHVGYVRGGEQAAAKVLDSWKCLASKTDVVLVLVGSYQLLRILALAPHLLGRQRPIEFPRYRSDRPEDLMAFEQILFAYSRHLRFADETTSLRTWNRLLFEHSLGCVGHVSKWLRACLGRMNSRELDVVTEAHLKATQLPAMQEAEIAAEIVRGERAIATNESPPPPETPSRKTSTASARKPFQRATRRSPRGGRA